MGEDLVPERNMVNVKNWERSSRIVQPEEEYAAVHGVAKAWT